MPLDYTTNDIQFPRAEAKRASDYKRLKPKLAGPVLALKVNMRGSLQSKLVKKNR